MNNHFKILCEDDSEKQCWLIKLQDVVDNINEIAGSRYFNLGDTYTPPIFMPKSMSNKCMVGACKNKFGFVYSSTKRYWCCKSLFL